MFLSVSHILQPLQREPMKLDIVEPHCLGLEGVEPYCLVLKGVEPHCLVLKDVEPHCLGLEGGNYFIEIKTTMNGPIFYFDFSAYETIVLTVFIQRMKNKINLLLEKNKMIPI